MTGNIVWIASYPKSGNTWFRAFVANLLSGADSPVHIDRLGAANGSSRALFDAFAGIDSANLLPEEADLLRPEIYRRVSAQAREIRFLKIHNAFRHLPGGQPLFPPDATRSSIYIARNPLDVVPSFAHFLDEDPDRIISRMNEDGHVFNRERNGMTEMLSNKMDSWSGNVRSWLEAPAEMKVHLIRYEDMLQAPFETFSAAAAAMGIEKRDEEIRRAIDFSSFEILREMELKGGFRERPPMAGSFFRQGKSGSWRESLSEKQASSIIEKNESVMRNLGYLEGNL